MIFEGNHWTEDGYEFHVKGKGAIMEWLFCGAGFKALAALTIKETWLRDDGEGIPVNLPFLTEMQAAFLRENKHRLKRLPMIERKVVETASRWLLVLFRNDSMYRTRMGWIICWIMENGDAAHPVETLRRLKAEYFTVEHRKDRIEQLRVMFDKVIEMAESRQDTYGRFVAWSIHYLQEHKEGFQTAPKSPPSPRADDPINYDPDNWYGGRNGIGSAWNAVHGGHG